MKITEAMQRIRSVRPEDRVTVEVSHTWDRWGRKYINKFTVYMQPGWNSEVCSTEHGRSLEEVVLLTLLHYTESPAPPIESVDQVCDLTP